MEKLKKTLLIVLAVTGTLTLLGDVILPFCYRNSTCAVVDHLGQDTPVLDRRAVWRGSGGDLVRRYYYPEAQAVEIKLQFKPYDVPQRAFLETGNAVVSEGYIIAGRFQTTVLVFHPVTEEQLSRIDSLLLLCEQGRTVEDRRAGASFPYAQYALTDS